jgi:hypothetical protein
MNEREHVCFSRRQGLAPDPMPISDRDNAPPDMRYAVISIPEHYLGVSPTTLRDILCCVMRTRPDSSNWSEYPNIWGEVQVLIERCEWYKVYDVIEAIHEYFVNHRQRDKAARYAQEINDCFNEMGIGWELLEGRLLARGEQSFEVTLSDATAALSEASLDTAQTELAAARKALSQRPEANLSGAVFHAFSALECVARKVCGDDKRTLGELVRQNPDLFPKPLDEAVSKAWGFASNEARHGKEGRQLDFADALACVGISATLCSYCVSKFELGSKSGTNW